MQTVTIDAAELASGMGVSQRNKNCHSDYGLSTSTFNRLT